MYNPEATIRILRRPDHLGYGSRGMERRIKRCCSDNPECELAFECVRLYTKFVNTTDTYREPPGKEYKRPRPSVVDTYKLHGLRQPIHTDILRY